MSWQTSLRVLLLALVLSSGACDKPSSTAQQDATFRFINRGDVITLDINQMSYFQDFRVTYGIREGLYSYGVDGFSAVPALAEKTSVSDDKLTWTFTLRDAKWSNGDPIVAGDFLFSMKAMLDAPGDCSYMLYCIRNARQYESGEVALEQVGLKAIDEKTLQITLENPTPYLPQLLAFPPFYPRHAKSMEAFAEKDSSGKTYYRAEYTRPEHVVTNGPFVLKEWKPGERLRFERNERYWDVANVKSPAAEMIVNNDPQSAFVQYEKGKVDFIAAVSPETAVSLRATGRADLRMTPAFATTYLSLNCAASVPSELGDVPNPLQDVRVRQALAMSVDKARLVKTVTRLDEPVANSFVPQRFFEGFETKTAPGYDVAAAKQLLADAGFAGGAGFPRLTIAYNSDNATRKSMAEMLSYEWKQHLGIVVELRPSDSKTFDTNVNQKRFTIATSAWMGDYVDPSTFLDRFSSTSLGNTTNWSNAEYDGLLEKARAEPDVAKREAMLEQASSILNESLPIIPLYHYNNICLFRDGVKGITPNAKNTFLLKEISVER
jgi:oligopeptide transport system substrate-binding protein